jgi:hypothetical protein
LAPQHNKEQGHVRSTDELVHLDVIIDQYRAELERLNYVRGSINVYLRSIRRLFRLMEEQGVALSAITVGFAAPNTASITESTGNIYNNTRTK